MESDSDDEFRSVVISNGSGNCRIGYAGEDCPGFTVPSCVGRPLKQDADCYVGDQVRSCKEPLSINYPIKRGIVTDWDDMEAVWRRGYNLMGADPRDLPMLVTEPPLVQRSTREIMTEMVFESMGAPAFFAANQGLMAFYSVGRTSGVIVHCGDGVTHCTPIYEGYMVPAAVQRSTVAGSDVTDYLMRLMSDSGYSFSTSGEREIVRKIKENHCYTAVDFETEKLKSEKATNMKQCFTLPDGQDIYIGRERFLAPEAIFQPSLIGSDAPGIHTMVYNCIMACDLDLRADLIVNFLLSGGSTLCNGFNQRLQKELLYLFPPSKRVRVVSRPEQDVHSWIGGSILASLSAMQKFWITKREYEEFGPCIIHQKCCGGVIV